MNTQQLAEVKDVKEETFSAKASNSKKKTAFITSIRDLSLDELKGNLSYQFCTVTFRENGRFSALPRVEYAVSIPSLSVAGRASLDETTLKVALYSRYSSLSNAKTLIDDYISVLRRKGNHLSCHGLFIRGRSAERDYYGLDVLLGGDQSIRVFFNSRELELLKLENAYPIFADVGSLKVESEVID